MLLNPLNKTGGQLRITLLFSGVADNSKLGVAISFLQEKPIKKRRGKITTYIFVIFFKRKYSKCLNTTCKKQ